MCPWPSCGIVESQAGHAPGTSWKPSRVADGKRGRDRGAEHDASSVSRRTDCGISHPLQGEVDSWAEYVSSPR